MFTRFTKKAAASCAIALTAAVVFSLPASAVPPPDVITKCEKDERYQMHHWYMLYGEPQTIYLKRVDATPQTVAYMQSISESVYHGNCYLYQKPGDLAIAYEAVREIDFREIAAGTGKPFVLSVDRVAAQRFDKKRLMQIEPARRR